jgi:hypothetical protein
MNVPLGCCSRFEPEPIPMRNRDIDYAFLGSVTYDSREKKWFYAESGKWRALMRRLSVRWAGGQR